MANPIRLPLLLTKVSNNYKSFLKKARLHFKTEK
jgi:hypothetical protein